jgi:hypothetical protein
MGGGGMIVGWLLLAWIFFVAFSLLFIPSMGVGGLFYAWLGTNVAVAVLGFFLALQEDA